MNGRVAGKVAFITGAARGQGRSHAVRLAEEGADIIAVDVCDEVQDRGYPSATEEDLAETVRLVEKTGQQIIASKVDVRDFDGLKAAVDDGVRQLGRLDIVSANAGIGSRHGLVHELPENEWQVMIDVNLTGVWHTCKAAVPHIIAGERGGSIVITCSTTGVKAYGNISHYVAAKHGVLGLMKSMAIELGPHAIRVNSILPTQTNTPMIMNPKSWRLFSPELDEPTIDDFARVSQTLGLLPNPWVEPVDISNALLFLSSDEARYITAAALPVDSGASIK